MQEHERSGIMRRREQLTMDRTEGELDRLPNVILEKWHSWIGNKDVTNRSVPQNCQQSSALCEKSNGQAGLLHTSTRHLDGPQGDLLTRWSQRRSKWVAFRPVQRMSLQDKPMEPSFEQKL